MDTTLWHQFAAPLRSFVARRAPREAEPEDVLQDVFVRIQEQLPNLRDADRIDAWIFQIARNVIADAFRRRGRREVLADRAAHEPVPPDDDDGSARAALASCLVPMVAQLPEPYREAILLTELCGLTQVEAAGQVGISVSGMKSRVQRGREHLRRVIGDSCRVETDVRGGVIECDPRDRLRPSPCSRDSMGMKDETETTTTQTTTTENTTGCCGGPAPAESGACCALDAEVKADGGAGCGCSPKTATPTRKGCC